MADKTFKQWLHEDGRHEALQDVYFEDQIGPGSEFLDWAESVYKAMQRPASANEPRPRSWPFTK
ncbi:MULTISPECIES: hypothetical protein [Pseudomonas syringae group]|uniref:Uncharacterized protein n=1 Tax=Pseudomonas savastanoi pv. glycinea TaxID=318 RepID=A0A3M3FQQ3_PSESG|nr:MULTISPECIES: hypothetical protein [Pseudomonas syringae group]RML30441.1 hypothetical protein ALQ97_200163 [Pseudomonas savastanoi pv. glycinea]RMM63664.1 hypothetical protein ALQ73_200008 [Pseudomonas savastanoi pv. glycinea]